MMAGDETDVALVLKVERPGFAKEDVDIELHRSLHS
jgi:HSP20 family molecular chaperone IbpA